MAKAYRHTFLRQAGNVLATTFVRAGLKVGPIHLLTVRGRKSGQPRTTPIAVVEQNGEGSPQHLGDTACLLSSSIPSDILLKGGKEGVPSFQEEDGDGKVPISAVT